MHYAQPKTVHVFPHSHTDLGWLQTVENYFEGNDMGFYTGSVETILTTTIQMLEDWHERTFTYAEMKFLKMWWVK